MIKGTTIRMWKRSLVVLITLVIVCFAGLIARLFKLQIIDGEGLQRMALEQQLTDTKINAQRGTIYDRNMKVLAQSATVWTVVLEPAYLNTEEKRELVCSGLHDILGVEKDKLLELAKKRSFYNIVKKRIESDVKDKIIEFKTKNKISSGIRLIEDYKRYYPFGSFASAVLGFTGADSQGLSGIEAYYDKTLKGEQGRVITAKNARGTDMPFDYEQMIPAQNGYHLKLCIDEVIQHFVEKNLEEKRQTILFLNRRGFSTFIMCRECGYTVKCKNCNISLTYHQYENKLKCHYCGYEQNVVTVCPECHSTKIRYFGTGTQRLEQEINKVFPNATTIRMDKDTVTKKNSHEDILNKFRDENIDILIGTQMIVKGHHFPNVTLVGVVAADSSLNIDDYRANERTFQILTQVAGRAGREKLKGQVIIQTYNPDNFAIQCAKNQDYIEFYQTEIALRQQLMYPPFKDIILINFNGLSENEIKKVSLEVYKYLMENLNLDEFKVMKPMPSPIDRIQNHIRWRMIVKGNMTPEANYVFNNCLKLIYDNNYKNTRVTIDVNPNSMM